MVEIALYYLDQWTSSPPKSYLGNFQVGCRLVIVGAILFFGVLFFAFFLFAIVWNIAVAVIHAKTSPRTALHVFEAAILVFTFYPLNRRSKH